MILFKAAFPVALSLVMAFVGLAMAPSGQPNAPQTMELVASPPMALANDSERFVPSGMFNVRPSAGPAAEEKRAVASPLPVRQTPTTTAAPAPAPSPTTVAAEAPKKKAAPAAPAAPVKTKPVTPAKPEVKAPPTTAKPVQKVAPKPTPTTAAPKPKAPTKQAPAPPRRVAPGEWEYDGKIYTWYGKFLRNA